MSSRFGWGPGEIRVSNTLRIKFDGPDKPEVISMVPDENIDSSEWLQDGDDWVLVIRFTTEGSHDIA